MLPCVSCYNIFILSHVVSLPIQAKQDTPIQTESSMDQEQMFITKINCNRDIF